jgi:hypothetical protein
MNCKHLFILGSFTVALGLVVAACGGTTPVAPTAAPTAQPTEAPTAAAVSPTSAPATAIPTLSPNQTVGTKAEDLAGIWRGLPGQAGDPSIHWKFEENGTYRVAFTVEQFAEGYSIESGTFSFNGNQVSLTASGAIGCGADSGPGTYEARITKQNDEPFRLRMILINDQCPNRRNSLSGPMPWVNP